MIRLAALVLGLLVALPAWAQPDWRQELKAVLPSKGSVRAVYTGNGVAQAVGYDIATGAWFHAYDGRIAGMEPGGVRYEGDVESEEILNDTRKNLVQYAWEIDSAFPTCIALSLVRMTKEPESVVRADDGGWVITHVHPAGERLLDEPSIASLVSSRPSQVVYTLDARGRIKTLHRGRHIDVDRTPAATTPDWFHVTRQFSGWTLLELEADEAGRPDWFSRDQASQFAIGFGAVTFGNVENAIKPAAAQPAAPAQANAGSVTSIQYREIHINGMTVLLSVAVFAALSVLVGWLIYLRVWRR